MLTYTQTHGHSQFYTSNCSKSKSTLEGGLDGSATVDEPHCERNESSGNLTSVTTHGSTP